MPVYKVTKNGTTVGYRWGQTGKVYQTKEEAAKQGRAIYAAGYRKK